VRVASKSEAVEAVNAAIKNRARRLVLEVVAQSPAEAAEVVRQALGEIIPFTVEVRVVRSV